MHDRYSSELTHLFGEHQRQKLEGDYYPAHDPTALYQRVLVLFAVMDVPTTDKSVRRILDKVK